MKRPYALLIALGILAPFPVDLAVRAASPTTRPALPVLPADSPPLPDFRRPVDYVGWIENRLRAGRSDDAAQLWDELEGSGVHPEDSRKGKAQLWGMLKDDDIPGLFTGSFSEARPADYRWDPKDHPDWERSYQMREASGLRQKLLEIASRKYNVPSLSFSEIRPSETQPAILATEDRLLVQSLLPSTALTRTAVKILLQDAWRAPGGELNPERMVEALTAALRIGGQQQRGYFTIEWLVGIAERSMAYDSAIRALRPGLLPREGIRSLRQQLTRYDSLEATTSSALDETFAMWLDLLQFAYTPLGAWPPRANRSHLEKLQALFQYYREFDADVAGAAKKNGPDEDWDLTGAEARDPSQGVRQIVQLHQRIQGLCRDELPQDAERDATELLKQFQKDESKHPFVRQLARALGLHMSRPWLLASRVEAKRRAVHLLCGLSERHAATLQWPATLSELGNVQAKCLIDPFSGRQFIYRIEGGQPVLYSVAMNGKDDGGKHDPHWGDPQGGDYVFWPVQAE